MSQVGYLQRSCPRFVSVPLRKCQEQRKLRRDRLFAIPSTNHYSLSSFNHSTPSFKLQTALLDEKLKAVFYSVLLNSESALPLEGFPVCQFVLSVKARRRWTWSNGGIILKARNRITPRKPSPSDTFLHHKSHTNRSSTEPGPPQWQIVH